jgi:hypothetical protein
MHLGTWHGGIKMMVRISVFSVVVVSLSACPSAPPGFLTIQPEPPTPDRWELTALQRTCGDPFLTGRLVNDEVIVCIPPSEWIQTTPINLRQIEVQEPIDEMVGVVAGDVVWMSDRQGTAYARIPDGSQGAAMTTGNELLWTDVRAYINDDVYDCGGISSFYLALPWQLQIRSVNEIPAVRAACEDDIAFDSQDPRALETLDASTLGYGPQP